MAPPVPHVARRPAPGRRCGALVLLGIACSGCGTERLGVGAVPPLEAHPVRFVGLWIARQRAGGPATLYELYVSGAVRLGRSIDPEGELRPQGGVAGWVVAADGAASCAFGERWHSPFAAGLAIAGVCSDEVARDIVLDFVPGSVLVHAVGDEPGWRAAPQWTFQRCPVTADDFTCE